ncbi:hypothetical protein E3N88_18503 [Mikania micrantha]|uniref:Uncharacterized protein n=1 Tax=Mikania micrantha TaxID=192012 RepID=A0A5N6NNI7_9ASTR|nr:hypothetical protein E3N88_18503 [Mikania micrantha]
MFTGILFSRHATARFVQLSGRTETASYVSNPPLSFDADDVHASSSSVPASALVDDQENDKGGGKEVHTESHHHSLGKSVAGGGVIIGGLVTTIFAILYCYIKIERPIYTSTYVIVVSKNE